MDSQGVSLTRSDNGIPQVHYPGDRPGITKVVISRISTYQPPCRQRARKACGSCREHKAKCSGDQPCNRCRHSGVPCVYSPGKQEREESEHQKLKWQVREYQRLLSHLQSTVGDPHRSAIAQALKTIQSSAEVGIEYEPPIDDNALMSRTLAFDSVQEDFNRNASTRATGFIGAHSETSWMCNLNREALYREAVSPDNDTGGRLVNSVSSVSYFLDNTELLVDPIVNTSVLPSRCVADALLQTYIECIHPTFPIVGRSFYQDQYHLLYREPPAVPSRKWLAILNLVFALATRYSCLVDGRTVDDPWYHSPTYFSRAIKLCGIESCVLEHPDLQQVQVEGLISIYLLSIGQVNRSWRFCRLAMSSAVSMGINLKNRSDDISATSKEIRCRVWWSIYTLETTLSVMTGRPPTMADRFCTAPLPLPFDEELFQSPSIAPLLSDLDLRCEYSEYILSPNRVRPVAEFPEVFPSTSLYFLYVVVMNRLLREAIELTYSMPPISQKPKGRHSVKELLGVIKEWLERLPSAFQLADYKEYQSHGDRNPRGRCLDFQYYSTMIVAGCIPLGAQLQGSATDRAFLDALFKMEISDLTMDSACQVLRLLPDTPDSVWLIRVSPWWCILHYLMQSITVLLIGAKSCSQHNTDSLPSILAYVQKGLRWLSSMAAKDAFAHRAWEVSSEMYIRVTGTLKSAF